MSVLHCDIETYSSFDLFECGVYRYVEAPDFEILLFAYAFDDEPVDCIALADLEFLPDRVMKALTDPAVLKIAHNANFERTCIARYFGIFTDPKQWECTMVRSATLGLPNSLKDVAQLLDLGEDKQKDRMGTALINFFSKPCKPTKANGMRTRNLPQHDNGKWELFISYCIQDVEVERAIWKKLNTYGPWNKRERSLWEQDQLINDSGILLDQKMIRNILHFNDINVSKMQQRAKEITGLENPNSNAQLKMWFSQHEMLTPDSLDKEAVKTLLAMHEHGLISDEAAELLLLRQEMNMTSISKYEKMMSSCCDDGRTRGYLQFYGANRSGRWGGRGIQVHNFPQNKLKDLSSARDFILADNFEAIKMLWPSVSQVLKECLRTSLIAENKFVVADFSAIEARVISWLANEKWAMEAFATHGKIYEAAASQMFNVPMDQITKDLRAKGKVATLALGYQGGVSALKAMGALEMGIPEEELPTIVKKWRNANKNIVRLWAQTQEAALECVVTHEAQTIGHNIKLFMKKNILFIQLPAGRCIAYYRPKITEGKYGKQLTYDGRENGKWGRCETHGGKLVENIVQAIARDCLGEVLLKCRDKDVKFHVHDEIIIDTDDADEELKEVLNMMSAPISWAPGLILKGAGFICDYYMKD